MLVPVGEPSPLVVAGLQVTYDGTGEPPVHAVRGVDVVAGRGRVTGLVGESGSGKTTIALATLMLLPAETQVSGSVRVGGQELVGANLATLRAVRWRRAAVVVQAPGRGFNPVRTVGAQVAEPLRIHMDMGQREARERSRELAATVGLDPDLLERYSHQLSGGERQRAMLAMAMACQPQVLVLDEPTSGLDSATRAAILDTVRGLADGFGTAVVLISHDVAAVARIADDIAVLYAGMVLEHGETGLVLADPRQPYTRDLLAAYPTMTTQKDLRGIRGPAPDPTHPPTGCPYHPRCSQAVPDCATWHPVAETVAGRSIVCLRGGVVTRLAARGLTKSYQVSGRAAVGAVKGVDLDVRAGEVLGVVGETGSGKSTLARLLLGIERPDTGEVEWEGEPFSSFTRVRWQEFRRQAAIVFQDPFEATSPLLTVGEVVREPLDVQGLGTKGEREDLIRRTVAAVGLTVSDAFLARRAHELSGGQLQRVAVARSLVLGPRLLVADEPTSMLDASEQAKLMVLLKDLQVERGMAMVFVSHDLALVRKVADRLVVLHRGRSVEQGPCNRVLARPEHEVTRRLLQHAPAFVVDNSDGRRGANQGAGG
ncbi:MAG: ABC transporter ATP-binding protein [Actinomycetota bacterium]|nr:ABC transporter ATP-binding protein [Actinomycetota bacterium]